MKPLSQTPEIHHLLQELVQLTGENETIAVQEAIRERLHRLHQKSNLPLAERLLELGKACAPHFKNNDTSSILYDENGLPR